MSPANMVLTDDRLSDEVPDSLPVHEACDACACDCGDYSGNSGNDVWDMGNTQAQ